VADVIVTERKWHHRIETRIELELTDNTKVPLFHVFFPKTESTDLERIANRLKEIAAVKRTV
jgi:hypothetical protein